MHIVYKTVNLTNHKFYIGVHKTNNLDDGYLGSGKRLKYAIKKYGKDNFKKEIIFMTEEEHGEELCLFIEQHLVDEKMLNDTNCYNLALGGTGSWKYINSNPEITKFKNKTHSEETRKIIREKRKLHPPISEETRKKISKNNAMKRPECVEKVRKSLIGKEKTLQTRQKISNTLKNTKINIPISEETRKKMSESQKKRNTLHPPSEDTKRKISQSITEWHKRKKNVQMTE